MPINDTPQLSHFTPVPSSAGDPFASAVFGDPGKSAVTADFTEIADIPLRPVDPFADAILSRDLKDTEDARTVGGFLAKLLIALLREEDGFDPKRPFGNSDWYTTLGEVVHLDVLEKIITTVLNRDQTDLDRLAADLRATFGSGGVRTPEQDAAALIALGWTRA